MDYTGYTEPRGCQTIPLPIVGVPFPENEFNVLLDSDELLDFINHFGTMSRETNCGSHMACPMKEANCIMDEVHHFAKNPIITENILENAKSEFSWAIPPVQYNLASSGSECQIEGALCTATHDFQQNRFTDVSIPSSIIGTNEESNRLLGMINVDQASFNVKHEDRRATSVIGKVGRQQAASMNSRKDVSRFTPSDNDVLFGRGKTHRYHPGNKCMQLLADIYRDAYDKADRDDKTDMTRKIVRVIQAKGGRFLRFKKGRNVWVKVSDKVARNKVSHALRDGRMKPLLPVDEKEIQELLPVLSNEERDVALQLTCLDHQLPQCAFGHEDAEILRKLVSQLGS